MTILFRRRFLSPLTSCVLCLSFGFPLRAQEDGPKQTTPSPPPELAAEDPADPVPSPAQPEGEPRREPDPAVSHEAAEADEASQAPQPQAPAALPDHGSEPALTAEEALAMEGLLGQASDQAEEELASHPLELYGFFDFTYSHPFWRPDAPFSAAGFGSHPSFGVGNLNIYLSKRLDESWSFLGEVRFLYAPNGSDDPSNPGQRISTRALDPADLGRPFRWGGVEIERVHVDYRQSSLLTLRFGHWLTPYGIWNIDHGSPTVISIQRPYIVGEELFPEHQTGLQAFGSAFLGDFNLGYVLALSNGRGPMDEQRDLDGNKGVTGRLELGAETLGDLRLGASYYRGRFTSAGYPTFNLFSGRADTQMIDQYDEQSLGADLQWDLGPMVLRAELAYSEKLYENGYRRVLATDQRYPDRRRFGTYALLGYRTDIGGVTPYLVFQDYVFGNDPLLAQMNRVHAFHGGLNWPITPRVTAKGEYAYVAFSDADPRLTAKDTFHLAQLQLAVAF